MKKIISLILSAIMLLSVTAGLSFNAFAKGPAQIDGVGSVTVTITSEEGITEVRFIPTETAEYYIHSTGSYDTTATLYLINGGEYEELTYNDDSDGYNFGIYYKCEKGKTYVIECGMYSSSSSSYSYNVYVEKSNIKSVTFKKAKVNSVKEFTGGGYDTDDNGKKFYYYDTYELLFAVGDKLTVNYTDGSKKEYVGTQEYWTDDEGVKHPYVVLYDSEGNEPSLNGEDDQYVKPWKVGRHYVTLEAYGRTFNVPIDITANGWYKKDNKWHYTKDGTDYKWFQKIDGKYYYFNGSGELYTGWLTISGKRYYFSVDGAYVYRKKIGNYYYYFNGAGVLQKGWIKGGTWMYGDLNSGALKTGWFKVGGKWYWFKADGSMVTGWQKIGGTWYYFASSGAMVSGWQSISSKWYYFASSGAMLTGWQKSGGKWYYMNSSGAMTTGWQQISGYWYYMDSSGAMVTGTRTIGGKTYKFDSSGRWINGGSSSSSTSSSSRSSSSSTSSSYTVYITRTGKKYHYDNHCNGGTYYASTLSEAKSKGLTPCDKCVH